MDPSPLDDGRASEIVADDSFISCALASAVGGGGPGLGELEEAAADLLGVLCLEDLYHPLVGGRGRAGGGLGGGGEGLGLDGGGGVLGLGLRDGDVARSAGRGRWAPRASA